MFSGGIVKQHRAVMGLGFGVSYFKNVHLGPGVFQTVRWSLFAKIINGLKSFTVFTKSSSIDV